MTWKQNWRLWNILNLENSNISNILIDAKIAEEERDIFIKETANSAKNAYSEQILFKITIWFNLIFTLMCI